MRYLGTTMFVLAGLACGAAPPAQDEGAPPPGTLQLPGLMDRLLDARADALPNWSSFEDTGAVWAGEPAAATYILQDKASTLLREGSLDVAVGGTVHTATLQLQGSKSAVRAVAVWWEQLSGPFNAALADLRKAGLTIEERKCRHDTEPASVGNVLYAIGRGNGPPSPLIEFWNCRHDGCSYSITLLYAGDFADQIECYGS